MEMKYTGIIIGKRDLREVDRLYSVYTAEQGRLSILGRGVRKPDAKLAGNLETLNLVEVYVSKGKGRGNITGAIPINGFLSLKSDFLALERVFHAISYFNKFVTQEEKDDLNFNFLAEYLAVMDSLAFGGLPESKYDVVTSGFLFKYLENLGYGIDASACGICEQRITEGGNFFSAAKGSIICRKCGPEERGVLRISDAGVKLLRIFYRNNIRNLSKLEMERHDMDNLKTVFKSFSDWIK